MSFLSGIIGSLTGQTEGGTSPIQSILTSLFGNGGQQDDGSPNRDTGLGELLSGLEAAGLGDVVRSWIGDGSNHSVQPDQIQDAMGDDWVQDNARNAGVEPDELLSHLSQYLPHAIDSMTTRSRD